MVTNVLKAYLANYQDSSLHFPNLSLHDILDHAEKFSPQSKVTAEKIASTLKLMGDRTDQKYYQTSCVRKYIDLVINGLAGRGFETTVTRCYRIADHIIKHAVPNHEITYYKGVKKTCDLIPTEKEVIGKGRYANIHVDRNNPNQVVKKTTVENLEHEFKIGSTLDHPVFVKAHSLYTKNYPYGEVKQKLVMDRVFGTTMGQIYRNYAHLLTKKEALSLLTELQNVTDYLYTQKVVWRDINDGNIFITEKHQLKICDFFYWDFKEDETQRAAGILLGAMEIVGWIIKCSVMRADGHKDREKEFKVLAPVEFFGEVEPFTQVLTFFKGPDDYTFMKPIIEELKSLDDEGKKSLVRRYMSHVIKNYDELVKEASVS